MMRSVRRFFSNENLKKFTSMLEKTKLTAQQADNDEVVPTGRAWHLDELRIKSNDDLHKLWYVLLREKNSIMSDSVFYRRLTGNELNENRILAVEKSMAKLKQVLCERKKVREAYKEHLETEYVQKKQQELQHQYKKQVQEESLAPKISFSLLRAKYQALLNKEDTLKYIEEIHEKELKQEKMKLALREKYDYRTKRVVDPSRLSEDAKKDLDTSQTILAFKNQIENQLKQNSTRISQEEILRSHVKNWKQLDLKQRRVVLGYLNAIRARDAKKSFLSELNLLSQKIAFENKNLNMSGPSK